MGKLGSIRPCTTHHVHDGRGGRLCSPRNRFQIMGYNFIRVLPVDNRTGFDRRNGTRYLKFLFTHFARLFGGCLPLRVVLSTETNSWKVKLSCEQLFFKEVMNVKLFGEVVESWIKI